MAKTQTKYFIIHKPKKYEDRFVQISFSALGIAMGKLDKKGSKNLYLYLVSNANNYNFELKVANYANWLGDPAYDENGTPNTTKINTYSGHIKAGIEELIKEGYLVEKFPNTGIYDFYEEGVSDNLSDNGQIIENVTNCHENDKLSECDNLSSSGQIMAKMTNHQINDNLSECDDLSDNGQNVTNRINFVF